MTLCCGVAVYLWYVWKREAKMNRVMEHHEAFLGIDDDVKVDEDVEAMMKRIETTTDTFHSSVTVDANEAKMIQDELKKKKAQSAVGAEKGSEDGVKSVKKDVAVDEPDDHD